VSIDEALAHIGRRVSVRRVVGTRDGRPLFSDVVGVLQSAGDDVVVRRADRSSVAFPRAAVVAAKLVPPAGLLVPDRELEEIAALGWRGIETDHIGDWLLRAAGGFTGRANSALAVGQPGLPLDEAVARVVRWYAGWSLPARFQVPMPHAASVDTWLADHGWLLLDQVRVLVADLEPLAWPPVVDRRVRIDDRPDADWMGCYHYRGGKLPDHARTVIERGETLAFASVRSTAGEVLAIARGSVDRGWLGVTAVEVAENARRQGLGGVVMRALAGWAVAHGARSCYLQVAVENGPALSLYLRAGFVDHHRYQYRVPAR
jgi:N-acetylglutamate synthase